MAAASQNYSTRKIEAGCSLLVKFANRNKQQIPMFRDRPLTWLFVIATIAVHVAFDLDAEQSPLIDLIMPVFFFGPLSAVAIWAIMSKAHRLARSGVFLAAVSLVAGPHPTSADWLFEENFFLTMFVVYAVIAVLATCLVALFRHWVQSRKDQGRKKQPWQFPLIELFGWTIIVAYASFACRFLNSDVVWQINTFQYVLPLMPNVMFAAFFLENTNPIGYWRRVVKFVFASLLWISCIPFIGMQPGGAGELMAFLAGSGSYLIAWSTVRMLDQHSLDRRKNVISETAAS